MKHVLLLSAIFAFALSSTSARIDTAGVSEAAIRSIAADVEGVIVNRQKARTKPGYTFLRASSRSVNVMKTGNGQASIQTGTLTCTSQQKRVCEVYISNDDAYCNGGCYFVGVRGAPRATSD